MKPSSALMGLVGALFVFAGSLIWTVRTVSRYPAHQRHLERKQADLNVIKEGEATLRAWQAARAHLEAMPDLQWTALAPLVRTVLADAEVDVRRREIVTLPGDWQAHQWEIDIRNHPLDAIGRLLTVLETQRPPWRIQSLTLTATDTQPSQARAHLIVERLEHRRP